MKKTLIVFVLLLLNSGIFAQSKTISLDLGKNSTIKHLAQTKDSGFMVLSGHYPKYGYIPDMKFKNYVMRCYDSKLNELWSYEPDLQERYSHFVSSDVTDYKYWIDYDDDYNSSVHSVKALETKDVRFARFNNKGFIEKVVTNIKEQSNKYTLVAAFSGKDQLFLVTNNIMTGVGKNQKVPEVPYLYRINHTDGKKFEKKKININLEKGGTFGYLGIYNEKIYLYQQRLDYLNVVSTTIFVINGNGEQMDMFELTNQSSKGKFFKYVSYKRENIGDYVNNVSYSPHFSDVYYSTENCLGDLKVDFKNNAIYFISFLTENKDDAANGYSKAEVSDIYISKFNLSGDKINSKETSYASTIATAKKSYNSMKSSSSVSVKFLEPNKFMVTNQGYAYNIFVSYTLTLKGTKILNESEKKANFDYTKIDHNYLFGLFVDIDKPEIFKFKSFNNYINEIPKKDLKKSSFLALNANSNYLLFKLSEINKSNHLEIMLFE
jgi:hypothetical protein